MSADESPDRHARAADEHPRPARSRWERWGPVALFLPLALALSGLWEQTLAPFVRRDDWPYLLPAHTPGAADVLLKVREEGRWLNYAWWWAVGQHSTPMAAALTFGAAYLLLVVGLWRVVRPRGWVASTLLGLALAVSPLFVKLLYWPGTLSVGVVVAAAGIWLLPSALRSRGTTVGWVVLFTALSVPSYPPLGALLLLAAVFAMRERPWRAVLVLLGGFLVGFALGVAAIYVINWLAFREVGPEIAAWRHPNPLRSLHDLRVNGGRYARQLVTLVSDLGVSAAVGVLAWVVALVDRRVRPAALRLAAGFAVVAGIECTQTIVTGVTTAERGSLWAWLALVLPAALLSAGSSWSRRAGAACLAVLCVLGLHAWRGDVGTHQETRRSYDAIVTEALRRSGGEGGRPVAFYQDPSQRATSRGRITVGTLQMMLYDSGHVVSRWCRPAECARAVARAEDGPVLDLGGAVVIVVPKPPRLL